MLYSALGDSITYGYDSSVENRRFVSRLKNQLAKQQRVSLFVQAKPGWTSKQLLKSLPKIPSCIWDETSVMTILVGGNDLLRSSPWILNGDSARCIRIADSLRENLTEIIQLVKRPNAKIMLATIYNPFPNSLIANECTDLINKSIRLVATREKLVLVDIYRLFLERESHLIHGYRRGEVRDIKLRGNPIHPNDRGHAEISNLFFRTYQQMLIRQRRRKGVRGLHKMNQMQR